MMERRTTPEECRFTYFSNNYKDMEQPCERCVESEKSTKQWLDESRVGSMKTT